MTGGSSAQASETKQTEANQRWRSMASFGRRLGSVSSASRGRPCGRRRRRKLKERRSRPSREGRLLSCDALCRNENLPATRRWHGRALLHEGNILVVSHQDFFADWAARPRRRYLAVQERAERTS